MLVDLLASPDFVEYTKEIDAMLQTQQAALESTKTWDETIRAQATISALRNVLAIPSTKATLAAYRQRRGKTVS